MDPITTLQTMRVVAALLLGASLGLAGAALQLLFRNPLAAPEVTGVSAGAAFGCVAALWLGWAATAVLAAGVAGGLGTMLLAWGLARVVTGVPFTLALLLAGVLVGAALAGALTLLIAGADPELRLPALGFWLLGGLYAVDGPGLGWLSACVAVGTLVLALLGWRLNLLGLEVEERASLGAEGWLLPAATVFAVAVLMAGAVAVAGMVGWIGLLAPHLARRWRGAEARRLLLGSAGVGALMALGFDAIAQWAPYGEWPLSAVAGLVGAPVLFWWFWRGALRGWVAA